MKRFFGFGEEKKKAPPPPTTEQIGVTLTQSIVKIKASSELLDKKEKVLEKKIKDLENEARERAKAKDKRSALMALKKKKMYESHLDDIGMQRLTLEQQIMSLEQSQTQHLAVEALRTGVDTAKMVAQKTNADQVDRLIEDMADLEDQRQEIAGIFQQSTGAVYDDAELLEELNELEAQELEQQLLDGGQVPTAAVPAAQVPAQQEAAKEPAKAAPLASGMTADEEAELAALTADLGI